MIIKPLAEGIYDIATRETVSGHWDCLRLNLTVKVYVPSHRPVAYWQRFASPVLGFAFEIHKEKLFTNTLD